MFKDEISSAAILKWCGSLIVALWASLSSTIHLLVVMMAIDFGTGLFCAVLEKKLDPHVSFAGLIKKSLIFVMIYVCHAISKPLALGFDLGEVAALAYLVNEIISITENCARAGVPIPAAVMDTLARVKKVRTVRELRDAEHAGLIPDIQTDAAVDEPPKENK